MKIGKAFPSNYLKADDLEDRDWPVTIKRVAIESIGQGEDKQPKPIVYFEELEKGLVCNKTNATIIEKMYGDETDAWTGKRITLWPNHDVEFKGELVSAIRVRSKAPATPNALKVSSAKDETAALREKLFGLAMEAVAGDLAEVEPYLVTLCGKGDVDSLPAMQVSACIKRIEGGWVPGSDKKK